MDAILKSSMLDYYDARADEYDEVYGGQLQGPTAVGSDRYVEDTSGIRGVLEACCRGSLLDAPCGTGFWLSSYAPVTSRLVMIDQSERMLHRARARVRELGVESRCTFLRNDVLTHTWDFERFDTALVGFFLSHLDREQEEAFFTGLRRALKPPGLLVVLDSIWTSDRARTRPKEGVIQRKLNDGREFQVYKRYFEPADMLEVARRNGFEATVQYAGEAFIAASANLVSPRPDVLPAAGAAPPGRRCL